LDFFVKLGTHNCSVANSIHAVHWININIGKIVVFVFHIVFESF